MPFCNIKTLFGLVSCLIITTSGNPFDQMMVPISDRTLFIRSLPGFPGVRSDLYEVYMEPYLFAVGLKAVVELKAFGEDGSPVSGPHGVLTLEQRFEGLHIMGTISGLNPGLHGLHVHEKGDLRKGCLSAGSHFNPYMVDHGAPTDPLRHVGDLGNIEVGPDGVANIDRVDQELTLIGVRGAIGRALVVHVKPDDLGRGGTEDSLKTGSAGGRLACGVISFLGYTLIRNNCTIAMPKLNRQLVTSVIADINELIAVGNEMCSWVGKVEHFSWRFPSRSARNVNVMGVVQRHKGSAGEMYILLLELAYDRLHFVLRLVVEFMDGYPFIEEIFEKVTSSKRPGSMSLASIVRTLWSKLKLIPETITRNMIKTKQPDGPVFPISRGCQASGSLYHCESCSSASKAIADLSGILGTALQDNGLSSSIVKERQVIRVGLFHKTQWDVMTRLTEAIAADIYTLLEINSITRSKSEIDAEEYQKSLNSFRVALDKKTKENKSFEIKIQEMERRLHSVQYELQSLEDSREGLIQKNSMLSACLSKTEEKSSNLEIVLSCVLKQIAEIGESKIALESTLRNLGKELESTRHSSTSETEKLQKILDRLREEKNLETTRHREEVKDLELRFGEVLEKLEEKCRQLELAEVKADKKIVAEETPEPLFSKGDPEIDMAQQLKSNQAAIDRLTRQNERLMRTLTRLREHRRSSQTD